MARPFVLAVAGGTASGKSTLADALRVSLGDKALSISHDLYYKTAPHVHADPGKKALHNYDHPDALDSALLAEHLQDLKQGRGALLPQYDFRTSKQVLGVHYCSRKPA